MAALPTFSVSGSARERGRQLGDSARDRVRATWAFYRDVVFPGVDFDLAEAGHTHLAAIGGFRPEYEDEIRGLAEGSGLEPWELGVLNARTEVMHRSVYRAGGGFGECTAAYFPQSGILAQNWDWMDALEELMILVRIEREDGHQILQMTEPGILGKIGFNSAGVGVCLNILSGTATAPKVPVHVLLRAVLDASSVDEARRVVREADFGTCSHLLIGGDDGASASLELYGDACDEVDHGARLPRHTNHYVGTPRDQTGDLLLPNSHARWDRAETLLEERTPQSVARMKELLLDRDGKNAICGSWFPLGAYRLGTVCAIVMDLPAREMHITPGHPADHAFERMAL